MENELYMRNYKLGITVLSRYLSIMVNIEKHLEKIDLMNILKELLSTDYDTLATKQRYYYLETKLNEIMGVLA